MYEFLIQKNTVTGISKVGFIRIRQFLFQNSGADETKLRTEFAALGYNASMQRSPSIRSAVLSVHATVDFTLIPTAFDAGAYEEAVELPIKAFGECNSFEEGKICLYRYRSGYCGISFLVENNHPTDSLDFMLDCSSSKNVVSHHPSLKHKQTIPPGEAKVLHHLLPDNSEDGVGWSWGYSATYIFNGN